MPASKKFRRARLLVAVLALLVVAAVGGGVWYGVGTVRSSFPETEGRIALDGLDKPVTVRRDARGIPQIYASTSEDLFRAQGYVTAQDRFYEMDTRRHITSGRLSEMFGESQVETDAFLRTLGWHRVAQKEWDTKLSASTKKYLTAYSAGVNEYLKSHQGADLSAEYAILGVVSGDYKPEKWTPVDSVAWIKAMAWDLRSNLDDEITRALLPERLDRDEIEELYPEYPYDRNKPIVSGGSVGADGAFDPQAGAGGSADQAGTGDSASGTGDAASGAAGARAALTEVQDRLDAVPQLLGPSKRSIGSNSWVVSGDHTTTGKPLLANDPHLSPALPSTWYQVGLHCTATGPSCPFDVSGFSFSGLPGVVIGHNRDISWGFTNLAPDVADLYLEKVDSEAGTVLYDGRQEPLRSVRRETIEVAGGKSRTITVRETRNGPLISDRNEEAAEVGKTALAPDSAPDRRDGFGVSLRWTALQPGNAMDAVFELNAASDFGEFRKAAADFDVPSQNLIYADTKGNIGYQAPGTVPVRERGDGTVPAPGWDPAYRWTGTIPFKAMPWELNPEQGYIVTANQAVVDEDYKYLLTKDWSYGNRSARIEKMIEGKLAGGGLVSPSDMSSMQTDNLNPTARALVPYLQKVEVDDKYVREAQQLLTDWDYQQDADSAPAAYYNAVWRNLLEITFGTKLPASVRPEGQCLWVEPPGSTGPVDDLSGEEKRVRECGERDAGSAEPDGGDRWGEVVRTILPEADNRWWRAPRKVEGRTVGTAKGRDAVLAEAMKDARYELTAKLGKDIGTWSWGRLHTLELENQTLGKSGNGLVERLLNRGPYQLGGGEDTVNATGWNAAAGYQVDLVPSMRMVVDLSDFDKSRWINLTGASGHVFNEHYTDQAEKWRQGELLPWRFSPARVEKATEDTLALVPE